MSIKCNRISQNFSWSFPAKTLPGTVIDQIFNDLNILISNRPEIETFWKEKTNHIVGVLIRSTLPGFMWFGKVDEGM